MSLKKFIQQRLEVAKLREEQSRKDFQVQAIRLAMRDQRVRANN